MTSIANVRHRLQLDQSGIARYDLGMPKRPTKRRTDPFQLARHVLDTVVPDTSRPKEKNPAAVALGRLGGLKGGKARAEKLTAKKRAEIAKKAAKARWKTPSAVTWHASPRSDRRVDTATLASKLANGFC